MRPAVLLFDIDGTLLDTGGAGRRAIERAFERCHGRRDACARVPFAGMTDRAIVRAGLSALDRPATHAAIDEVLAVYLSVLEEEVGASEGYRVHEGVHGALDAAAARPACAVGLGTGNVKAGALVKLERGGIHQRFGFGGFGCDHEDRAELLRIGAARGAAALGAPVASCRVVVIGDTPRDIAAAHAIGAEAIAVCTGGVAEAELGRHRPAHVFRDLGAPGALAALLG